MAFPQEKLKATYTIEQYLKLERHSEERHEYIDGDIYEMAGESLAHSRINMNLAGEIRAQLKGKNCEALSPNMKVRTKVLVNPKSPKGFFSYPDLTIVCGEPLFHDKFKDVLINPKVVFEVLSPSTESYDRGKKFQHYRTQIDSLTDYVLVSQDEPLVEHYIRQDDGSWKLFTYAGLKTSFAIDSVDCRLSLEEIYDRIEFQKKKTKKAKKR